MRRLTSAAAAALAFAMAGAAAAQEADQAADQAASEEGEAVALPGVVVYGAARDERALLDTPNAVTVIDAEKIARRQATTYEELLGAETGLSMPGGPRGISQEPNIRGFQDEQIVLRVDGARQNFNLGHRGRFFLDPSILKRVEIIRGGAATLYGSGALGGAIALETKDAVDVVAPGETFGGDFSLGYSSQGDQFLASSTLAGIQGDLDALAFLSWRPMGSDLSDGDGEDIRDSHIDAIQGLAKIGWTATGASRFEATYQRYEDNGETPPNANATSSADTVVDRDVANQQALLEWTYAPLESDLVDLEARAYWNETTNEEDRIVDGRLDETTISTIGFELVNRSSFTLGGPVRLSYGLEAFEDEQEATRDGAPRPQSPDAKRRFIAGFAQADLGIAPGVTLTPGLRYDYFELRPEANYPDRSEGELSPRIALNWRPTEDLQLYASAAQSFRAPSLTELYADGVHFPLGFANNVFVPNPDLQPEIAKQIEIGTRYVADGVHLPGDRIMLSMNAYAAQVDDYIDQTVIMDFMNFVFETRTENVDAELWGFEAEASYETELWFVGAGLTIPRGRAADGGALGSIPGDKLALNAGFKPTETLLIGARATFVDGQDDAPEEGVTTPGYSVFDVYTTYQPLDALILRAGVDNVLDRTYRIHPNELNQPGVAVKVGATVKF